MKAKIICKTSESGHGVTFVCSRCDKTIFVNTLCRRKVCNRCGSTFKKRIEIKFIKE